MDLKLKIVSHLSVDILLDQTRKIYYKCTDSFRMYTQNTFIIKKIRLAGTTAIVQQVGQLPCAQPIGFDPQHLI